MEIVEFVVRLGILLVAIGVIWLGVNWWRGRLRAREAELRAQNLRDIFPDLDLQSVPTILAFATPNCVECRVRQTPVLEEIRSRFNGGVHIHKLDAVEYSNLADHFQILTVPTTVIIDPKGHVRHINHGLAEVDKLIAQVKPLVRT